MYNVPLYLLLNIKNQIKCYELYGCIVENKNKEMIIVKLLTNFTLLCDIIIIFGTIL